MEKREQVFSVDHLEDNLRKHSIKSTKITLFAQAIKLVLHLLIIMALARLLNPQDYGLFAIVAIFTGLGVALIEGGLSMATVQSNNITHQQASNLFWASVFIGLIATTIIIIMSPLVVFFFKEEALSGMLVVMALSFFFGGMSVQHDAILHRQMRFKVIAFISVISLLIGGVFGVWFAMMDYGYWALVISYLLTSFVRLILCWWYVSWIPSWIKRKTGARSLLSYGLHLALGNVVAYLSKNATPFSIGLIGGVHFLGLYNRTFAIASIPATQAFPPVLSVLRPALFRVAKDKQKLKFVSISIMSKVAWVTTMISLVIFLAADWIVLIMLGEKWLEAVPILKILAMFMFASPITSLTGIMLMAVGNAKALFRWQIISFLLLLLFLVFGSFWGGYGILYSALVSLLLVRLPLFFIYASFFQPVKSIQLFGTLAYPLILALITIATIKLLENYISINSLILGVLFYVIFVVIFYVSISFLIKKTREDLLEMFNALKNQM